MDKALFESMLSLVKNPGRVEIKEIENLYCVIQSAENTNDTLGWFYINNKIVENVLQEKGLKWCYVFEKTPKNYPFVYMFVGEGITRDFVENEISGMKKNLPKGRELYVEEGSFASINLDKYNKSKSVFEYELRKYASNVFEVYEP